MKTHISYPIHKDGRGSFQELFRVGDVKFGQLSLLKVNSCCVRGGHYHTRKDEWFACIYGKCIMEMKDIRNGANRIVELNGSKPEFIQVYPYESHKVINKGTDICELLVVVSEPYNQDDADTFQLSEK
jgi:UDP-2-acetamido-2,6-beta-L-arabino-hexul-4-ose reductase